MSDNGGVYCFLMSCIVSCFLTCFLLRVGGEPPKSMCGSPNRVIASAHVVQNECVLPDTREQQSATQILLLIVLLYYKQANHAALQMLTKANRHQTILRVCSHFFLTTDLFVC